MIHQSDCAVHNEPAYPNQPCDCRDDELNRKLAEFAGFRETTIKGMWAFPIGAITSAYTHSSCEFSESLDFCFRRLWPALLKAGCTGVSIHQTLHHSRTRLTTISGIGKTRYYGADAETPALAFCLAAEKLIDKKGQRR